MPKFGRHTSASLLPVLIAAQNVSLGLLFFTSFLSLFPHPSTSPSTLSICYKNQRFSNSEVYQSAAVVQRCLGLLPVQEKSDSLWITAEGEIQWFITHKCMKLSPRSPPIYIMCCIVSLVFWKCTESSKSESHSMKRNFIDKKLTCY